MDTKLRGKILGFVKEHIVKFHAARITNLDKLKLDEVLANKTPYLFRAKNLNLASDLIGAILDARLSSSEEGSFGNFLEELAIYVAQECGGGQKSAATGIDIELTRNKVRYLIAVKSGKNWGNSSSQETLNKNFKNAVKVIKQSKQAGQIQPTLGICYGKFKTKNNGAFLHIGGQSFWHLLSGDPKLYIDVIEPLGHEAEKQANVFNEQKGKISNRLTLEFTQKYCDKSGAIDWAKLVR